MSFQLLFGSIKTEDNKLTIFTVIIIWKLIKVGPTQQNKTMSNNVQIMCVN